MPSQSEPTGEQIAQIVANVRERAGLPPGLTGPADPQIAAGVLGFAREFEYWYSRVLAEALPKYRRQIIDRINPMIRGMQLEGLSAAEVAERLVSDYAHRNYVTAGGWALEQLAIAGSPRLRKSTAEGIDAEWHEAGPPPVSHLFVIKSGPVTRNSDILKQLKAHGRDAQVRLIQTDKRAIVKVYYVVSAGHRSSTFADGIYRPSSAEFWAIAFDLESDEKQAIDLALAMAQEAGVLIRASGHASTLDAMTVAVAAFIAEVDQPTVVDWEYLAQRNMIDDESTKSEDEKRDSRARQAVIDAGHEWPMKKKPASKAAMKIDGDAEILGNAVAATLSEVALELTSGKIAGFSLTEDPTGDVP